MGVGGKRTGPKPPKDRNRDPRASAIPAAKPSKAALVEKLREAARRRDEKPG